MNKAFVTSLEKMTVEELLLEAVNLGKLWGHKDSLIQGLAEAKAEDLLAIEIILKSKIIKAATLGSLEVKTCVGEEKGKLVTMYQTFNCPTWVPDGNYSIVKV
jgi:hypothetical protein